MYDPNVTQVSGNCLRCIIFVKRFRTVPNIDIENYYTMALKLS